MRFLKYLLFLLLVFPLPLFAAGGTSPCPSCPLTSVQNVVDLLVGIVNQAQVIFWIVAAGSAFYAAFLYIRGGSSSETLKKAQKQIIYTVIAIALGVMAYGLPSLISDFLKIGKG